jgi:hypothetical protein
VAVDVNQSQAVVNNFEQHLKKLNPERAKITYSVDDLNAFIDGLADCSALVQISGTANYGPHDKVSVAHVPPSCCFCCRRRVALAAERLATVKHSTAAVFGFRLWHKTPPLNM